MAGVAIGDLLSGRRGWYIQGHEHLSLPRGGYSSDLLAKVRVDRGVCEAGADRRQRGNAILRRSVTATNNVLETFLLVENVIVIDVVVEVVVALSAM